MAKLIPLSSKKMKEMGIVKSKNGYLMTPVKEKTTKKPERYIQDKAPKEHKEPVKQSNNRVENKQEEKRLSDRGIY